jgi:mRNA-degrading endonuclease RelE of RelBE toxin-antitoxin system
MTTQVVLDTTSQVVAKLQTLAPEQQQQVLDFVEFLTHKYVIPLEVPQEVEQKRIPDLNRGEVWMSDDFNDPLPDEFWMGEGVI